MERLLDAGAVTTGKTNLDDLAFGGGSAFGESRNPLNPKYSTGGSSSGSGAAVAGGMVDVALGGDEGGSIRIPSAWCGLVGMKATHGLVPSYGMTYMDHTIDHIGPMTRTVTDNARMLEVIAGTDWRDPQWVRATPSPSEYLRAAKAGISGLRIGVVPEARRAFGLHSRRSGRLRPGSHHAVWYRRTRPAGRTADHRPSLRGGTLLRGGIRIGVGLT